MEKTKWYTAIIDGAVLALQFLTTLPIHKDVPWETKRANWSVKMYPFVGLVIGFMTYAFYSLLSDYTPFSTLALSFFMVLFPIFLTGGLHMDGMMDVSDGYFSYRDQERRLEIMKDSRVGAFGVLSLIVFLCTKWLFIYETIGNYEFKTIAFFILFIPIFSRIALCFLIINGVSARTNGMAYAIKQHVGEKDRRYFLLLALVIALAGCFFAQTKTILLMFLGLLLVAYAVYLFFYRFFHRAFGGITGDMLGSFIELEEWGIWLYLWLLHSFAIL